MNRKLTCFALTLGICSQLQAASYDCKVLRYDKATKTGEEVLAIDTTSTSVCRGSKEAHIFICTNTHGHNIQLLSIDKDSNEIVAAAGLVLPKDKEFPDVFTLQSMGVMKDQAPEVVAEASCTKK